jgi:hypothetical protein
MMSLCNRNPIVTHTRAFAGSDDRLHRQHGAVADLSAAAARHGARRHAPVLAAGAPLSVLISYIKNLHKICIKNLHQKSASKICINNLQQKTASKNNLDPKIICIQNKILSLGRTQSMF